MNDQRVVFNKAGLGFNPLGKQQVLKNIFVKASSENFLITYFKCNELGHKVYDCNIKKIGHTILKKILVSKETMSTNPKRPKKIWILKLDKWLFCMCA